MASRERPRPQDGRAPVQLRTAVGAATVSYSDELKEAESVALRGGRCAAERRGTQRLGLRGGGTGAAEPLRRRLAARRPIPAPPQPVPRLNVRLVAENVRTLWSPLRAAEEPRQDHCPRHGPSCPSTVRTRPPRPVSVRVRRALTSGCEETRAEVLR